MSENADEFLLESSLEGEGGELRLSGELDLATRSELVVALGSLVADGARWVTIDLAGVSFMDSTGLSALLEARRLGAELTLRNPVPRVRKLLDLVMIDGLIPIESD